MKKIIFLFFSVLVSQSLMAQTSYKVLSTNQLETVIDINIGQINQIPVETSKGAAVKISLDQATPILQEGCPDLPKLVWSIAIPNQTNSTITVLSSEYIDYPQIDIAPSKGQISRQTNPSLIPYVWGKAYQQNEFYPSSNVSLNSPYILRDLRGQSIVINPVQYNPITKTMRVFSHLKIKISFEGISTQNTLASNLLPNTIVEEFDGIYANQFINYKTAGAEYSPIKEQGTMLILCPSKYINEINPFIKWKEMKGIKTYLVETDTLTGGVSELSIKNIAKWYFQNKQIAYLLLVGDDVDIPPVTSLTPVAGPSDNAYSYINGNDHYPEFIVGRFSGQSISEISTQVKRTLTYEKTPNVANAWMSTQIGIGSEFGTGDDNQFDFEHMHEIVDSNKNQYVFQTNIEMYDDTCGVISCLLGTDLLGPPSSSMLGNAINSGASLINYCGHGGPDGIVTSNFQTADITTLNNANKLPFVFVVGCSPGAFVGYNCFAENLQHAKGPGYEPYGAISSFMSSINQYWDEPMQAQDEFNGIMRGSRPSNLKSRLGAMCIDACMSMIDHYSLTSDPLAGSDMADTWIFFGDPTVSIYTKNAGNLSMTFDTHILQNSTAYEVHCPVDGATIGLYYQNQYLASTVVSGGMAYFNFPALTALDTVFITATKQNYTPAFGTSLVVNWATNINELNDKNNIDIFPNPVTDLLHIKALDHSQLSNIKVLDASGRLVMQQTSDKSEFNLDTKSLTSGMYMIQMNTNKGLITKSFTKQ